MRDVDRSDGRAFARRRQPLRRLPAKGTTIDNFGFNKSCDSFGAYHFMGTTLISQAGRQVAFAVVPIDCANGSADELSTLASHEIIETATDPTW